MGFESQRRGEAPNRNGQESRAKRDVHVGEARFLEEKICRLGVVASPLLAQREPGTSFQEDRSNGHDQTRPERYLECPGKFAVASPDTVGIPIQGCFTDQRDPGKSPSSARICFPGITSL